MWRSILLLTCLIAIGGSAHAQRSDPPRIPQAITGAELRRYGDILGLSDEQRLAVEGKYELYLDEFEPLRAEMIEVAVSHPRHSRSDDEVTQRLPDYVQRTRGVDEAFFARIEPLLTESQRESLPRVRSLRERTLLSSLDALARFIGDGIPDVRELLEALDPPAEVLAALAPSFDDYENRLTSGIRGLFDAMVRLCGAGGPEAADEFIERVRALRAMNRKVFDDLAPMLPEVLRRQWRDDFFLHAYGNALHDAHVFVLPRLEAALATELSDAERAAIQDLHRQATQIQEETIEKLAEMFDREAIRHAPPGGAVGSPGYLDTINATRRQLDARAGELHDALKALLGKERLDQLKPVSSSRGRTRTGLRFACGVVSYVGRVHRGPTAPGVPGWRIDPLSPLPVSQMDIDDLIAALGIEGEQRSAVIDRFNAYAERMENDLKPLRTESFRYSAQGPPQVRDDPLERARAAAELRSKMRALVRTADAELMENVQATLVENDDLAWHRIMRLRERALVTLDLAVRAPGDPNRAAEIDIMRMLLRQRLDPESWELIADTAAGYEAQLSNLLAARFEAFTQYSFDEVARRDGWRPEGAEAHRNWRDQAEDLHRRHQAISALNREMIMQFTQALPTEAAAKLLDEYNRLAFPLAYSDPANMAPALARAAGLTDVTPTQRDRVAELRFEFAAADDEIRRGIIDACAAVPPDLPMIGKTMTPERTTAEERFAQEFARLTDQRAEINRRALRGLRMTLAPAQLRRLDLPEVD